MKPLFGKFRGIVTDAADPLRRGRVRVRVPAISAVEIGWAEPCLPLTAEGGGYVAPPVVAVVWVEFEQGDVSRPILCGRLWDDAAG